MKKNDLIDIILNSDIIQKWHFFGYHFRFYEASREHPFARSVVESILEVENKIPKAGQDYVNKLAAINSKEKDTKHYDQLLQVLAELLIVNKAVTFDWGEKTKIEYEPKVGDSKKNPELRVSNEVIDFGLEVKSPEYVNKHNERASKSQQIPSRSEIGKKIDLQDVMLPRDNPVKDFLISADKKFEEFKKMNANFYSVLVIVRDDFIYEPISAILSPQAGLFTENSFAKDAEGNILKFKNVDCVIITRHLFPIVRGTRDEPLPDLYQHSLDYGRIKEFPYKVIINNPWSELKTPEQIIECFQVLEPSAKLGAEYLPSDFITWLKA